MRRPPGGAWTMHESLADAPWRAWAQVATLPRTAPPAGVGVIRRALDDFVVEELPVQEPAGAGEHLWLWVEKRGENTAAVAQRLARAAGVKPVAVGYAGRKDRHAVTRQWFSVHLPGTSDGVPAGFEGEGVRVLCARRHARKLRVGALRGNRFALQVSDVQADPETLERRLREIAAHGVPNYFGEQRFGRDGANLDAALRLFAGRRERDGKRRGLYLSAARSAVFNGIAARRVREASWNRLLPGEAVMLDATNSFFVAETCDAELERRLRIGDVHPSGALWGEGLPPCRGEAARLETAVAAEAQALTAGLEAAGLRQERRALRLCPREMTWSIDEGGQRLRLEFVLPAGAFATAVLRDLLDYRDAAAFG